MQTDCTTTMLMARPAKSRIRDRFAVGTNRMHYHYVPVLLRPRILDSLRESGLMARPNRLGSTISRNVDESFNRYPLFPGFNLRFPFPCLRPSDVTFLID